MSKLSGLNFQSWTKW